jgi:hypothetical protein
LSIPSLLFLQTSDERMVIIQAAEVVENVQFGPAQLALFRVHNRVLEVSKEGEQSAERAGDTYEESYIHIFI